MGAKKYFYLGLLSAFLLLIPAVIVYAFEQGDCPNGYVWDRMSGVGCKQANCNNESIPNAHYSYESYCVCGTSGSIAENDQDPNKECYLPADNASCPSCVYACVHFNEECPNEAVTSPDSTTGTDADTNVNEAEGEEGEEQEAVDVDANTNVDTNINLNTNTALDQNQNVDWQEAGTNISLSNPAVVDTGRNCVDECNKFLRGKKNASVILAEGTYPKCLCQIDVRDDNGTLTSTINVNGEIETTLSFDSAGNLIKKDIFNRKEESERIRIRLGYRYSEEEIDALLANDKVDEWFRNQIRNIDTRTGLLDPQFWWQHFVAVLDHGFDGNSADFVDVHNYGRCGDSMLWLERDLLSQLNIGKDEDRPGQKHEGFLSITGEKYSNLLNHTSIMIRPAGLSNLEWDDLVKELKKLSGGQESNPGIPANKLQNVDPRLLDAKVLDPYKKKITTVREFIKGWSYIRIS